VAPVRAAASDLKAPIDLVTGMFGPWQHVEKAFRGLRSAVRRVTLTSPAMEIERTGTRSVIDVLDRVLDKGIVIDAWVRVSLAGIDLVAVEARVVVASIATYLQYSTRVEESRRMTDAEPARPSGGLVGRRLPIRPRPQSFSA
jgi:gas vesicle structural protein